MAVEGGYSTTAILVGNGKAASRRAAVRRVAHDVCGTEEIGPRGIGIIKTVKNFGAGVLKRTNLFAPAALSSYQILPVESTAMPYGSESFPDGLIPTS